ncbi:NUDIX hydrolase [Streptomyces sp. NPDC048504]|uniref:NUDIX hydrolase n=1 Tax=Streptomyces sp. NPDC048504 TaxID=3365559 RepID=UPI0037111BA2
MEHGITVVCAGESPPAQWNASLFLAGPTPRSDDVASWRPEALAEIEDQWGDRGGLVVFVPEPRDGGRWPDYDDQRHWELYWGDRVDAVLFWIPRGPGLPGLTTNDEWGRWKDSGRSVLGTPPGADQVRYQRDYAQEVHVPLADTLAATISHALGPLESGARRIGGQRHVPLQIWRTEAFQSWLAALEGAGNELREARQEWIHRVGPRHEHMLFSVLQAVVYVTAEDRLKTNEVVLSRPDVASVVAYRHNGPLEDTEIVLVREFRTTGSADDGFVRELPGGSRFVGMADPRSVAANELREETGLVVAPERLRKHHVRQVAATLSTHRAHLYSVELTGPETEKLRSDAATHGEAADSERTYVEVARLSDLTALSRIDWSTLGAILEVLLEASRVVAGGTC